VTVNYSTNTNRRLEQLQNNINQCDKLTFVNKFVMTHQKWRAEKGNFQRNDALSFFFHAYQTYQRSKQIKQRQTLNK